MNFNAAGHRDTEYFDDGTWVTGPALPEEMTEADAVAVSNFMIMICGGAMLNGQSTNKCYKVRIK